MKRGYSIDILFYFKKDCQFQSLTTMKEKLENWIFSAVSKNAQT